MVLARLLLGCVALYLRASPFRLGELWLLNLCRRLLARLPPFRATVRLSPQRSLRLHAFQLGGLRHSDILSEWLLLSGTWQPALTRWLRRRLCPGDTFVDVGANTGYFSLLGAALVSGGNGGGGSVVAIEACERTMERLRENLTLNGWLGDSVRTVQIAAAESSGETDLFRHRREPLYSTTVVGAGAGGVEASASVWSVMQGHSAVQGDRATAAAVSALTDDDVWQRCRVATASMDEILTEQERREVRVIKVGSEMGSGVGSRMGSGMEPGMRFGVGSI